MKRLARRDETHGDVSSIYPDDLVIKLIRVCFFVVIKAYRTIVANFNVRTRTIKREAHGHDGEVFDRGRVWRSIPIELAWAVAINSRMQTSILNDELPDVAICHESNGLFGQQNAPNTLAGKEVSGHSFSALSQVDHKTGASLMIHHAVSSDQIVDGYRILFGVII